MDNIQRFNPDEPRKRASYDVFKAQAKKFIEDTRFTEAPPRTPDSQLPGKKREEIELKTVEEMLKDAQEMLKDAQENLKNIQDKLQKYISVSYYIEKCMKKYNELKRLEGGFVITPEMRVLQGKMDEKRSNLKKDNTISLIQDAKHQIHWIKELHRIKELHNNKSTHDENDDKILEELERTEKYLSSADLKKELRRCRASVYGVSVRAVIMIDIAKDLAIDNIMGTLKKNDWKEFIIDIAIKEYSIPELANIEETSLNIKFIYEMGYNMHEKDNTISDDQRQSEEYEKIARIVLKSWPDYKKLKEYKTRTIMSKALERYRWLFPM